MNLSDKQRAYWSAIDTRRLSGRRVQLLNKIVYYIDDHRFEVPEGLICDFASTPEYWPLPNKLRSAPGAVLHDGFYQNIYPWMTRPEADRLAKIVWDCDPDMGPNWSRLFWAGVRLGGSRAWSEHRAQSVDAR